MGVASSLVEGNMVRTYRKTDIDVKWYSVVQPLITIGLAITLSLLLYTAVDQNPATAQAHVA